MNMHKTKYVHLTSKNSKNELKIDNFKLKNEKNKQQFQFVFFLNYSTLNLYCK